MNSHFKVKKQGCIMRSLSLLLAVLLLVGMVPATPAKAAQRDQVEAFVERLYTILLGRGVDATGLQYWTDALVSGADTGANVAAGIVFSQEFASRNLSDEAFVTNMYQTVFNRQPDTAGLNYWLSVMANGETRAGVGLNLLNSPEFGQICGQYGISQGTAVVPAGAPNIGASTQQVQNFVKRLYSILLGRDVDAAGLKYWSDILITKQDTGAKVASNIVFSPELAARNLSDEAYVTCLYQTVFNRDPDTSGKTYWLGVLSGGEPRNNVGASLLNSSEFGTVCQNYGIEQGMVTEVPVQKPVLTDDGVMIGGFPGIGKVVTSNQDKVLNVRDDAGTQADKVAALPYGTLITILDVKLSPAGYYWYKISAQVDGTTVQGYVLHEYVDIKEELTSEGRMTVQEKINHLYDLLCTKRGGGGTAYFNDYETNRACPSPTPDPKEPDEKQVHGSCKHCNNGEVVSSEWFKELFGTGIKVSNFPKHYAYGTTLNNKGYSCFGFACFAQWYLYADTPNEKVTQMELGGFNYTEADMKKYAQPGDVIRWYYTKKGIKQYHSGIVYQVTDKGVEVLDCNMNLTSNVKKHVIEYEYWSVQKVYLFRAAKTEDLKPGLAGLFLDKDNYADK